MLTYERMNTLSLIMFAFAAGLMVNMVYAWAQDAVNVTTTEGGTEEVPTLTDSIQTGIEASTALVVGILALAGLIIKSGVLDRWVSRKKQEETFGAVQMNFLNLKKVLEDKALTKFALEKTLPQMSPADKLETQKVIDNINLQIQASTDQLNFYADKYKQYVPEKRMALLNPDLVTNLPREKHNVAYDMEAIPLKIGTPNTSVGRDDPDLR